MPHTFASPHKTLGSAMLMLAGSILLSGCALNGGSGSSSAAVTAAGTKGFTGTVHGGQNPVTSATVILWAAGTTGTYGTGAAKVATTTSDGSGNFSFDNSSGVSPCTIGTYNYITATGGNSGAGTNKNIALMAAIPTPCSSTTGATAVMVNEVTTIAAVTALQQFMSINTSFTPPYTGTGTVPWTIGAPSTNTTGLANAFLQSANLASIATGTTGVTTATATLNSVVYTTTITPDSGKINGLADVLAVCINDTTGNLCTGSAGVLTETTIGVSTTSGGSSTPSTIVPQDTIQAAYNMATLPNPQLYSGSTNASATATGTYVFKYWTNSSSSATYLATLWANINTQAPFQTYTTATPNDTAIDVGWRGGTSGANTTYPEIAFDSNGNVWYALYGASTGVTGIITAYNQSGQMLFTPVSSTTISGGWDFAGYQSTNPSTYVFPLNTARRNGLAIDTNNNAWYAGFESGNITNTTNSTGVANDTYETPLAQVSLTGTSTGYLVGISPDDITIDGSNNIFFSNIPNGGVNAGSGTGRYYYSELAASGGYSTYYGGEGRESSTHFTGSAMDNTGLVWAIQSSCATTIFRANNTIETAGGTYPTTAALDGANQVTLSTTSSPTTCVLQGAIDASNNMWGVNGYLEYIVPGTGTGTGPVIYGSPTVTAFPAGTGTSFGGLDGGSGVAIDGLGNVWVTNTVGSSAGGISEFAVASTATAGVPALTPLSPFGTSTTPIYGFGSSYAWADPIQPRIDSSGNVFIENTGNSSIFYLVGVAAPVVTPISLAIKNSTLATRP